jgi:hypothetical protein
MLSLHVDNVTKNELAKACGYMAEILTIIRETYERLWWLCGGGRATGAHASMSPSDLPGSNLSLQSSRLRLEPVLLLCFRYGQRCLLPDLVLLQPTIVRLPRFEFRLHGLAAGIPKNEVYSGVGL